jgi:FlaA1/EpsC-like NDP-sugar epimerase
MFIIRRLLVVLADVLLVAAAYTLSFLIRFDFHLPVDIRGLFLQGLGVVLLIKPTVFCCVGFYRNLWRYASVRDAVRIFRVVGTSSLIAAFVIMFSRHFTPFPRSIIVLDWILLFFLVSISRLGRRVYREIRCASDGSRRHEAADGCERRNALIVGAGEAGNLLLNEIRRQPGSVYNVMGYVDDDDAKQGMLLNGIPVLGKQEDLRAIVARHGIDEIIIAIPSARGKAMRTIVEKCNEAGVRFRTLPAIGDIVDGKVSVSQIKDVEIADLLGREHVVINETGVRSYLTQKTVLVSGAAGSIGSEICRQVARFGPDQLILLDNGETPLFYIERELCSKYPDLKIIPLVADVRNKAKVEMAFAEYLPDVVFHAAAYKHVPMMEYNPTEAVSNNIGGTRIMADAAHRFGARNFVMISTDKAVNPTNIMGASKRVAEIYVQALARQSTTKFTTVRFGNVLGSNGSVIPLFMEQIRKGGPVTVTDPHVMRYFMTIPEASQLVLQAGCLGNGGEIFVLDMGEPVRIADLAEEMIRLSGLVPYEDIDIVFTGLRPGEKLFEELLVAGEGIMPTTHDKIRIAAAVEADLEAVTFELNYLLTLTDRFDTAGIVSSLRRLVAEFTPSATVAVQTRLSMQRSRPDHFSKKTVGVPAKILPLRLNMTEQTLAADGP